MDTLKAIVYKSFEEIFDIIFIGNKYKKPSKKLINFFFWIMLEIQKILQTTNVVND